MVQKPKKRPDWLKYPYDNSVSSQALFTYKDKPREDLTPEKLNYETVGALLETYVDAMHLALVMDEPKMVRLLRENPEQIRDPSFFNNNKNPPPKFIREALGDYRSLSSFFRNDTAMVGLTPWMQNHKQPPTAAFANAVHGQLRKAAGDYGKKFELEFFPPQGQDTESVPSKEDYAHFKEAKHAVDEFKRLQQQYGTEYRKFSKEFEADISRSTGVNAEEKQTRLSIAQKKHSCFLGFLESDGFNHVEGLLRNSIDRLVRALSPRSGDSGTRLIDKFYLKHKESGKYITIDNTKKLDDNFFISYPSLAFFSLNFKGKHDIDQLYASKQTFDMFSQVIGVESQITDHIQHFHNDVIMPALKKQDIVPIDDLLFGTPLKRAFMGTASTCSRGIQLLYSFHKIAGQLEKIYPEGQRDIAYRDMERILTLARVETPWVAALETPKEVALIIYALERRSSLKSEVSHAESIKLEKLHALANEIGKCGSFEKIALKDRKQLVQWLGEMQVRDEPTSPAVEKALTLLEASLQHMPTQPSLGEESIGKKRSMGR